MRNRKTIKALVLLVAVLLGACSHPNKTAEFQVVEPPVEHENDVVFGAPDAAHTIFMYASYHCNYCRYFFSRTFPKLKEEYLDTGKLKLAVKWLDLSDRPEILNALQAAVCIGKYGVYEKYHELLLVNPDVVFEPEFQELLDDIMQHNEAIAECMLHNNDYHYLRSNVAEFRNRKLAGTPSFVLDDHAYSGYLSFESIEALIAKEFESKIENK